MSNDTPLRIFTSSQESMVLGAVPELDLQDLDLHLWESQEEQPETKYDISHLPAAQQPVSLPQEHSPPVQMPTNDEFAGDLNFELIPDQQDDTKSWTYSPKLKKVFIEMDKTLPIRVKCSPLHNGLFIRAVMAYCQPTHKSEPVTRCHNHLALSNKENPYLHHVLSCKNSRAIYDMENGFYFVVVPLDTPQPGSDSVQMDFVFHCKNSCSTGINRRLTEVVFSLENGHREVLGRRKLLVRICSCPKRDREKEEKPLRSEHTGTKKRKLNCGKKVLTVSRELQPIDPRESEIFPFSIKMVGLQNYEALIKVAYGLISAEMNRTGDENTCKPILDELTRMMP